VDYFILPQVERGRWARLPADLSASSSGAAKHVYTLRQFEFAHGIVPLLSRAQWIYAHETARGSGGWFSTPKRPDDKGYGGKWQYYPTGFIHACSCV
jgi:hypothetical protein